MSNSRQTLLLMVILLISLGVRVAAAFVADRHAKSEGRQFLIEGDANGYWELASKMARGDEYSIYVPPRRVLRTPGFPLLLAGSIRVFGDSVLAASLVTAAIGTFCCALTAVLARKLTDETTALWAAAIVAVSPLQIGSNIQILSETWFSFWLLLSLITMASVLVQQQHRLPATASAFVSGIVTGMTVLVRPGWILWPWFCAPIIVVFGRFTFRRKLVLCGLVFLGCYAALFPWGWRNHTITGHWIFTSLWSGPSLYDGLHPGATGASDMTFVDSETVYSTMSEYDANEHYKKRAFQYALQNPRRAIELGLLKAGRYLSPTLNAAGFSGGPFSLVCLLWYLLFWTLVGVGCYELRNRPLVLALLGMPFVQFLLVHMVFVGSIRYRLPVEFPLTIIATRGLVWLMHRVAYSPKGTE